MSRSDFPKKFPHKLQTRSVSHPRIIHATISQTEAFWFLYIGSIGTLLIYYRLMTCDDSVIVFVVSDFPPRLTAPELLSDDQHH